MNLQTVSLKDIRAQLSELIARVVYGGQDVIITRFGKPVATLISYEEYDRMMNPRKRFSKKEWEKGFKLMDKARTNTKKCPKNEVERMINKAVAEVREERRASGGS